MNGEEIRNKRKYDAVLPGIFFESYPPPPPSGPTNKSKKKQYGYQSTRFFVVVKLARVLKSTKWKNSNLKYQCLKITLGKEKKIGFPFKRTEKKIENFKIYFQKIFKLFIMKCSGGENFCIISSRNLKKIPVDSNDSITYTIRRKLRKQMHIR